MSLNKRSSKSLVLTLGLVLGGVYASTTNIHAAEKVEKKVEEKKAVEREIVTASSLNVRKGPSTEDEILSSVTEGTVVEVLETKDGWNKVKLSEEEEGWVSADYTDIEKGTVTANKLNIRKGPSTEDEKIGELENKTEVEILAEEENWFKVEIDEDTTGWVSGDYILTDSEAIKEEQRKAEEAKKAEEQAAKEAKNETVVESATQNNSSTQNNNESQEQESSQSASTGRIMNVVATAYTGHSITATGTTPKWGTIAVDPKVIPYGTKVYIPQFDKVFIAEDCGGAIKGNKIDIYMDDEGSVYNWGRKTIEIQILG
ncbi:MAG: SH3 domain-containing protein [Paraclostridium sp.]